MSLKNKEWKEFVLSDLFDFEKGSNKSLSKETSTKEFIDYVGATSRNNGNVGFVNKKYSQLLKKGNCLVFINTGEGSVGDAIYKKNSFIPSNNVTIGLSDFLNEYIGNFIVAIINNQSHKYSYGYIRNERRLKRDKILLPITQKDDPDYEFMENYMRAKEQEKINAYKNIVSERINKLKNGENYFSFADKEWKEFFIEDVVEINSGKDIYKAERIKGETPYVSATAQNNGIGYFVGNENKTLEAKCLSVNRNGSVGYSFYHEYPALFSNDCRKLRLKHSSKHIGIFISQQITGQRKKYGYGYKMGTARLKRQMIMLPINENKEPDYEFMDNYMKYLELKKLKRYLDYK